jgi:hypothetical protein
MSNATRVLLDRAPFRDLEPFWRDRGKFPADWVTLPGSGARAGAGEMLVMAFRRVFRVDAPTTIRIHVSADERYELFLDGQRIGRGSERGDRLRWHFETYNLTLDPGEHALVVRVWWLGPRAPHAQITCRPAFLCCADNVAHRDLLSTGFAPWLVRELSGYSPRDRQMLYFTGDRIRINGTSFAWGFERCEDDASHYVSVERIGPAYNDLQQTDQPRDQWILTPATLPAMLEAPLAPGTVRHVEAIDDFPSLPARVDATHHRRDEAIHWSKLLASAGTVRLAPHTTRRVILDLNTYACVYPRLTLSGEGEVRLHFAESLFDPPAGEIKGWWSFQHKGHRDAVDGKHFVGNGDAFVSSGGAPRSFDALWWNAGRYVELIARAGDSPLVLHGLAFDETHYPHAWDASFDSIDARLASVIPLGKRVIEMCSHETYMDCPYYEQLMYVGDTRLEALVTYAWTRDDRLPRKALQMFAQSRKPPGFTQARYPCSSQQIIPPFSAWWVAMLHDHLMWRGDHAFVESLLPDARGVLDAFLAYRNADGLIEAPLGWNFVDWVPGWGAGMPKDSKNGVSGIINAHVAWTLLQAAQLEKLCGEPELAALQSRRADELSRAIDARFWSHSRGMYADDLAHTSFSEHMQCLILLGDSVPESKRSRVADALLDAPDLARCTVYFQHYLFETYALLGRVDRMIERMHLWFDMTTMGLHTTVEMPEPSRSDCHAWGAHPLYHYLSTICGIRPAAAGMREVTIRPQLGPLTHARGSMPHPAGGSMVVDVRRDGNALRGTISLPAGVCGTVIANGKSDAIAPHLHAL